MLNDIGDVTPELWYAYVDHRLANAISPVTINIELGELLMFLRFLDDAERVESGGSQHLIDTRMLYVEPLKEADRLPRDVPVGQLRQLLNEIEAAIGSDRADERYKGLMDKAWFHLMLLGGLRTGEIRRLRRIDIDFESRRVTIERSKGLRDRVICIGQPVIDALHAYLDIRGTTNSKHIFLFRHKPLSASYCGSRLRTYGERCGVVVTPHQLRHSFSTMLLNAGVPIPVLQKLLGHENIETTLQYTRLYDSTVATGYYQAMDEIEGRFDPGTEVADQSPNTGELLAMLNTLQAGVLTETQQEILRALRAGILAMDVVQGASDDANGLAVPLV